MLSKLILIALFCPIVAPPDCCQFDKKCFTIFINALYARNVLSKEAKIYYVRFADHQYDKFISRKVTIDGQTLRLKREKSTYTKEAISVISISMSADSTMRIRFETQPHATLHKGTVCLKFINGQPVFSDAFIIQSIQ